jgi:hypothetical protein
VALSTKSSYKFKKNEPKTKTEGELIFEARLEQERQTYEPPTRYTGMTGEKIEDLNIEIEDKKFLKQMQTAKTKWSRPK